MQRTIYKGKGTGYRTPDGRVCMIRCFFCGQENWAMTVASGFCAWCNKEGKHRLPNKKVREADGH